MDKKTDFISPVRVSREECEDQSLLIFSQTALHTILNSVPDAVVILNQNLQIVYCNSVLASSLGVQNDDIFGKRPGEAFNCVNYSKGQSGCGSSIFCRECGLIKSVLLSNAGKANQGDCILILKKGAEERHLDVRLSAVPAKTDHEVFTVLTLKDVSLEKRKNQMQETFVHDILNKIFIVSSNIDNIMKGHVPLDSKCINHLHELAEKALKVVENHRTLMTSETQTSSIEKSMVNISSVLRRLHGFFSECSLVRDKSLRLLPCPEREIATDPVLLERALENLIKNALEASEKAQVVTFGYDEKKQAFFVHNEQVIPRNIQLKLFTYPVSTKGPGRGMGLYGVKFIVETLLKGEVNFVSEIGRGTVFYVKLNSKPKNTS